MRDGITSAAKRCADLIDGERLVFIGVGVGKDANMQELKRFTPNGIVLKSPTHKDMEELLVWVSYRLSNASKPIQNKDEPKRELDSKFETY